MVCDYMRLRAIELYFNIHEWKTTCEWRANGDANVAG